MPEAPQRINSSASSNNSGSSNSTSSAEQPQEEQQQPQEPVLTLLYPARFRVEYQLNDSASVSLGEFAEATPPPKIVLDLEDKEDVSFAASARSADNVQSRTSAVINCNTLCQLCCKKSHTYGNSSSVCVDMHSSSCIDGTKTGIHGCSI
jgi:hypothetical protein